MCALVRFLIIIISLKYLWYLTNFYYTVTGTRILTHKKPKRIDFQEQYVFFLPIFFTEMYDYYHAVDQFSSLFKFELNNMYLKFKFVKIRFLIKKGTHIMPKSSMHNWYDRFSNPSIHQTGFICQKNTFCFKLHYLILPVLFFSKW